jgi:cob(I)alamin adenosyltransferase
VHIADVVIADIAFHFTNFENRFGLGTIDTPINNLKKYMSLFTGKGDDGTTKIYGCDQQMSKSSIVAEALGSLDEINSFLGLCKVVSEKRSFVIANKRFEEIVHSLQQTLFMVQAQVGGFPMEIPEEKVKELEMIIAVCEREMPPIKNFFISGGTELAAKFDFARTIARRAERRVVAVFEEGKVKIQPETLAFLNRLSSILYVLARLSNHKSGITEESPNYK